ncbi:MAG: ATP-binding protein [Hyalangium sp.]|uniref:ATP-binding protein n=1 Tax=Hyalangium sp. TaxID=2028555 RepID=UPI00389A43F5
MTTSSEAGTQYRHFDAMPLGLGVIRQGRVVYANASMLGLLGYTAEELVGRPVDELSLRFPNGPAMLEGYLRRMRGEWAPPVFELQLSTPTGERRLELSITIEGQDAVVLMRDVSARAHHRIVLQRLAELGAGLPGLRTEQEVLTRVFGGLAELGFTFAYVMPQGEQALLERLYVPAEFTQEPEGKTWEPGLTGVWSPLLERTWREGSAYDPEFAQEASRFLAGELSNGVGTRLAEARLHVIGVRIEASGMRRAVLVVAAPWLREEELPPLRLFGAQVSAALEAALTISQLSAQNTALAALNRLASTAATAQEPRDFFVPGAREITRLLDCDTLGLFLRKDGSEEMELVYAQGLDDISAQQYGRMPVRGSLSGQAMEQGSALVLEVESVTGATRENMLRQGYSTVAVVPLRVRSRLVGTLVVAFRKRRGLSHLERETLQAMGAHFAAATESHRLLTEVRRRADDLALIHEVSRNMVATREMDLLMQIGVKGLALIARASDAFLLLLDATGQRLEIRSSVRQLEQTLGYSIPLCPPDSSASAKALQTRAPVVVTDAENEPGFHPDARSLLHITAGLALPLVVRDRAIGVAIIIETREPRRFTESEVERASAITNQLALALEQARLIEDLKQRNAELARTQEQLVQRERLAALGELAAVVAHEVRNPLGAIFNSVSYIRKLIGAANPALPMVEIVAEEADRLNRMVDDLLYFARPPSPTPALLPLRRLLEETVHTALADATGKVEVVWALETEVQVLVDERQIRQAFLNLALNAVQAMPEGGMLRVGVQRPAGARAEVQVEFTDTGTGIPEDVRARIFEPFFTTKAQGTGLGLALVKRIIESHSGRLLLESEPGRGTTFHVLLPHEPESAQPVIQPGA